MPKTETSFNRKTLIMCLGCLTLGIFIGAAGLWILRDLLFKTGNLGPVAKTSFDGFGQRHEGTWIKSPQGEWVEEGFFRSTYVNGVRRYQTEYKSGKQQGIRVSYYASGFPSDLTQYSDGKPDGPYIRFDTCGRTVEMGRYVRGTLIETYRPDLGPPPTDPTVIKWADEAMRQIRAESIPSPAPIDRQNTSTHP